MTSHLLAACMVLHPTLPIAYLVAQWPPEYLPYHMVSSLPSFPPMTLAYLATHMDLTHLAADMDSSITGY
jgi:hypothetical protein